MKAKRILFAVYGTLRRGERAHSLLDGCQHEYDTTVTGRLLNIGSFPGLVRDDNQEVAVEVYSTEDQRILARLDAYEGYSESDKSESLYYRGRFRDDKGNEPFIYYWNGKRDYPEIPSGDWKYRV